MIKHYDPFREALSLRHVMDQLFEQSFVHPNLLPSSPSLVAPMDVREAENGYEVDVALPGIKPDDIELIVDQNSLTIRGHSSRQDELTDQQAQWQRQKQTQSGQSQSQQQVQFDQAQSVSSQQQNPIQHNGEQQKQSESMQRPDKSYNWLSQEIAYGSFERTVTFSRPIDTDKIETHFEQGILTVLVPFSGASRPKRIKVTDGQQQRMTAGVGRQ